MGKEYPFSEGEPAEGFFLLASGTVKLAEDILGRQGKGASFRLCIGDLRRSRLFR
ncbi:MAG: cyclic nucleotide-binding domain-containing protein [Desulfobacterales bacterium]|nr:cyclic nucleotide-binding domain-containing protein [Desulfobacterales bacterium]